MKINAVIVDDEKIIADGFLLTFKKHFNDVNFAVFYNSDDVISYSKSNRIDLLICDIDMPGKNGIELAKTLKIDFPDLKILFLTGMNTFDYVYNATKIKDVVYVLKIESESIILNAADNLVKDIKNSKDFYDNIGDIRENYNDLKEEQVEQNLLHIFKYGNPLYDDTKPNTKSLLLGKFLVAPDKTTCESIINLFKNRLSIIDGEIFFVDNDEIISFLTINENNINAIKSIQDIIMKQHNLYISFIFTKKIYSLNEFSEVFNKCNDIFAFSNIKNNYISAYEDIIGNNESESIKIVNKIKDYIWSHMDEDVSLKKMSDVMYYNESYLSRLFKKLTGSNFKDFVTLLRIEKAKYLLTNTEFMIKDICKSVGFDSTSHFQFFFKKNLGKTPLEYRRDCLELKK